MIILLEGPDGAGKTTLYKQLSKDLNYHFIRSLDRNDNHQYAWWRTYIESEQIYVIDRGFISELVYRPIKKDRFPNINLEEIGNICTEKLFIIYCKTKDAYKNMLTRGDDYITSLQEHNKISIRYDEVISTLRWFTKSIVFYYDYNFEQYTVLISAIQSFIEKAKRR